MKMNEIRCEWWDLAWVEGDGIWTIRSQEEINGRDAMMKFFGSAMKKSE